jgi:hypothetical protein
MDDLTLLRSEPEESAPPNQTTQDEEIPTARNPIPCLNAFLLPLVGIIILWKIPNNRNS